MTEHQQVQKPGHHQRILFPPTKQLLMPLYWSHAGRRYHPGADSRRGRGRPHFGSWFLRARSGCTEAVDFLLGVYPNYRDKNECTLLVTASTNGNETNVRILLEADADPNLPNINGQTPLMWACSGGHELIVNLLLQSGADPNIQTSSGVTALTCATYNDRHLGMFMSLLAAGAAVNAQDGEGCSALMRACKNGCLKIVKLLLQYNPDLHLCVLDGSTALIIACALGI